MRGGSLLLVCLVAVAALSGCGEPSPPQAPLLVHVPADQPTIQAGVDAVGAGGLVLVAAGHYPESVTVATEDVTVRGADRNRVIIDGEGIRPHGIVAIADGARVENLTVTGATFYGVLVTGLHGEDGPHAHGVDSYEPFDPEAFPPLRRFAIDHVTAYNNGLYGIYAFNAQHGVIRDSYASGSADSGFYVGQCKDCDILIHGNVAERNAIGFENANASDSVVVAANRFSGNRVGAAFLSNYQEAFLPQQHATIVGNVLADNTSADSPSQATGGFGTGLGLSGTVGNLIARNLITGNPRAGILLANTEDLPTIANQIRENAFAGNGTDMADVSAARAPARGNCLVGAATTIPDTLLSALTAGCEHPDATQPAVPVEALPRVDVPPGVSFLRVAAPRSQPDLDAGEVRPHRLPDAVAMPDIDAVPLPAASLLSERTGVR